MFGKSKSWKLFTFNGHPVYMELFFVFLVAVFVFMDLKSPQQFMMNLMWIPILFVSVLWHEIGHAIAIDKAGYGKSVIILQGMGGVTINQRKAGAPWGKSVVISVMGPVFSFSLVVVFGIAAALLPSPSFLYDFCSKMAFINLIWAIFNMLPIFPLDGGNIMMHIMRKFMKDDNKALLTTAYVSLVVLVLFVFAAFATQFLNLMFVVILGMMFGFQNYQIIQQLKPGR